nr:MAG TPA: hypothetical protein [Bacteriophage sp.]
MRWGGFPLPFLHRRDEDWVLFYILIIRQCPFPPAGWN